MIRKDGVFETRCQYRPGQPVHRISARLLGTRRSTGRRQGCGASRSRAGGAAAPGGRALAGFGSARHERRGLPVPEAGAHRFRQQQCDIARGCATPRRSRRLDGGIGLPAPSLRPFTRRRRRRRDHRHRRATHGKSSGCGTFFKQAASAAPRFRDKTRADPILWCATRRKPQVHARPRRGRC